MTMAVLLAFIFVMSVLVLVSMLFGMGAFSVFVFSRMRAFLFGGHWVKICGNLLSLIWDKETFNKLKH